MQKFRGAIFDIDGTLADSMGVWRKVDFTFLAKRGLQATEDYIHTVSKMNFREAAEYTIARFSLSERPEDLVREWDEMVREEYRHHILLKPGAEEYLRQLHGQGIRLGVATALSPEFCEAVLSNNGVLELFSAFAYITEVTRGKGFPDIYLLAADRLHLPPDQCIGFEDILPGIRGMKEAGMMTCAVYDPSAQRDWEEIKKTADYAIFSFGELLCAEDTPKNQ